MWLDCETVHHIVCPVTLSLEYAEKSSLYYTQMMQRCLNLLLDYICLDAAIRFLVYDMHNILIPVKRNDVLLNISFL